MNTITPNLLRYSDLCKQLSVGKTTIQRWMDSPKNPFPKPRYIKRTAFFIDHEVNAWLEANFSETHGAMVNFKNKGSK
jgi:predicted DNA-binding transcriptional regulator AlpA